MTGPTSGKEFRPPLPSPPADDPPPVPGPHPDKEPGASAPGLLPDDGLGASAPGSLPDDELADLLSDDELLARLSRLAAAVDPVPERLLAAARDAFGLRELDARVAELVRDSAVGASAIPVRGPAAPRMLSFEVGDVAVECTVTPRQARRDILGQLVGGTAATVDAQVPGAPAVTTQVGDDGWFGVRDLPAGPVRLRCRLADGTTLVTSWAVILASGG